MFSSRSYQRCFIHLFAVILYFSQLTPSLQDSCLPSISTVLNVSHCPTSKQEWDKAAKNKNCQDSVKQNCTSPAQFKYHCLIRSDGTVLVEVCAPEWKMNGFCPSFKVQDGSIIHNFDRDCSKYTENKCPSQYNSTEVYKFPKCYTLLPSSTPPLTTLPTTPSSIKSSQTSDFLNLTSTPKKIENQTELRTLVIVVVLLSCALVITIVVFLCTRCKEKIKCNNSPIGEEEVPLRDNPKPEEQDPRPDNPKPEEQDPRPDYHWDSSYRAPRPSLPNINEVPIYEIHKSPISCPHINTNIGFPNGPINDSVLCIEHERVESEYVCNSEFAYNECYREEYYNYRQVQRLPQTPEDEEESYELPHHPIITYPNQYLPNHSFTQSHGQVSGDRDSRSNGQNHHHVMRMTLMKKL